MRILHLLDRFERMRHVGGRLRQRLDVASRTAQPGATEFVCATMATGNSKHSRSAIAFHHKSNIT